MANAKIIKIEYDNGTIKELSKVIAAEFDNATMHVDMVNVSRLDMIRIAYGMLMTIDEMGKTSLLEAYAGGEGLPDESL